MRTWFNRAICAIILSASLALPVRAQQRVEYFWDTDPGVGKGTVLQDFEGTVANISAELDVSTLSVGVHTLGVRILNANKFSSTYHRLFYIPPQGETITRVEYSWDKVLAPGKGKAITFTAGNTVNLNTSLKLSASASGMHTIYIRALSTHHHSQVYARTFYIPPVAHKVKAIEYFFDTDPGVGKATRMAATLTSGVKNMAFEVNTDDLSEGVHKIGIRTLTDATWSDTKYRQFLVRSVADNDITRLEYFWNNDPGYGEAHPVQITKGKEITLEFEADMTDLPEGVHTLGLRAQSGSRGWSSNYYVSGIEFEGWDNLQDYLLSLEDTEDVLTSTVYARQFRNTDWQPFYVPFSLTYNDWSSHFELARINCFYQYDDDEDGVVDRQVLEAIKVTPKNGDLKPNHPYLIRAKFKEDYSFSVDEAKMTTEEINSISCSTVEAQYTFTGNYTSLTGMKTAEIYRLRGGTLSVPESDEEVLPPYRWYLTIDDLGNQLQPSASEVKLQVLGFDDATSIDDQMVNVKWSNGSCFDLSGRRVVNDKLGKGIYIINHKKYLIK